LCNLVKEDKDLLACIRNNAIGIYHLADKPLSTKLNKLKKTNAEAFFYWSEIQKLL